MPLVVIPLMGSPRVHLACRVLTALLVRAVVQHALMANFQDLARRAATSAPLALMQQLGNLFALCALQVLTALLVRAVVQHALMANSQDLAR